jgi:hypothetical protein
LILPLVVPALRLEANRHDDRHHAKQYRDTRNEVCPLSDGKDFFLARIRCVCLSLREYAACDFDSRSLQEVVSEFQFAAWYLSRRKLSQEFVVFGLECPDHFLVTSMAHTSPPEFVG